MRDGGVIRYCWAIHSIVWVAAFARMPKKAMQAFGAFLLNSGEFGEAHEAPKVEAASSPLHRCSILRQKAAIFACLAGVV